MYIVGQTGEIIVNSLFNYGSKLQKKSEICKYFGIKIVIKWHKPMA